MAHGGIITFLVIVGAGCVIESVHALWEAIKNYFVNEDAYRRKKMAILVSHVWEKIIFALRIA